MPYIALPEYLPDMPDFNNPGSGLIQNLLPRTPQSYGPWPGLSVVSGPLTARCQGAFAVSDTAGNLRLFMGDAGKLYRMDPSSATPANVSKSATTYTTGSTERWSSAYYGTRVIMTNYTDAPQSYVEGSSALFIDLITSGTTSLKARYASIVKDWLFFGNTTDGTFGPQPQRVWWSAIDDPTNFPTPGTSAAAAAQSDFQDLFGTESGWVQGIVGNLGAADGAIFQERAVVRVQYIGPPAIFDFHTAEGVRGTPAPGSIVQIGALVYYLGEDGFYVFDGSTSTPIGFNKVDKTFFSDLDQSLFHRISACVDPINKIVYWAYPGAGHDGFGNCNRLIAYNWALGRWAISAANDIQCEILMRSLSFGYTLEQLDNVPVFAAGGATGGIDNPLAASLDSRVWTGGRVLLSAFDTSHQLNNFTGANLAATAETSETQAIPGQRAYLTRSRPMVDGTAAPSVAIGTRNRQQDSVTYGAASAADANGFCFHRSEGRYLRGRISLPAGSSFTHLLGLDIPDDAVVATGQR